MFPYGEPTSHHEVNEFMTRHGAGTRTAIPRDNSTWHHSPSDMHENKPARIRYYITGHMAFGQFFLYELPAASVRFQMEEPAPSWYRPIMRDATGYLATHDFAFTSYERVGFAPARVIDLLGNLLVENGYPRALTAFTIALYRYNTGNLNSYTAGLIFREQFLDIAHLAADDRLTMHQKLDVLARQISRANLDGMLAEGAPYTLIRDMFPMQHETVA